MSYFGVAEQKTVMQNPISAQAVLPKTFDDDPPLPDAGDLQQAGEEAARAVARMRLMAIDNWDQVAHFTQAALAENGLSYREQELHTGVGASTVYRMALGNAVGVRAVQQFAAFAAYGSRREETKAFWTGTLSRFNHAESEGDVTMPSEKGMGDCVTASPGEIAALYAHLVQPANRKTITDLLRALQASEAAR